MENLSGAVAIERFKVDFIESGEPLIGPGGRTWQRINITASQGENDVLRGTLDITSLGLPFALELRAFLKNYEIRRSR